MTNTIIITKAVTAGGISMLLAEYLSDPEFVMLLMVGTFASTTSFMYDWVHAENGNKFVLQDCCDLAKSLFYGIPMMILVYYVGILNTPGGINIPLTVWGIIAMWSAGGAVAIVEWVIPNSKKVALRMLGVKSDT